MALKPLFFYGTLRHLPLLAAVLQRDISPDDLVAADLPDHAVFWVRDQPFPMIADKTGAIANGMMLMQPSTQDVARLNYYEGGFDYDIRTVTVRTDAGVETQADVYFPLAGQWEAGGPWSLADWERDWGEANVLAAHDAMGHFGVWTPSELADRLPMLRRRAHTQTAARKRGRSADHRPGADQVEVLSRRRVHSKFFALDHMVLRHPRYDGTTSPPLDREVFMAGHAVVVLPYDPVRDEVLIVEQFRPNVFALGDASPWIIEAVAGLIDPGETAQQAAHREAAEEAGVSLHDLEEVSAVYTSPGSSTEFLTLLLGLASFDELSVGGGLESEGEDIRRIVMPYDVFQAGLQSNRFRDAPLITLGFWLMLNRERLRASG